MAEIRADNIKSINGTYIRVKRVFGNIPLEKALRNLVQRRISEEK